MDTIGEVGVRAQAGVVCLGATFDLGEHAGDAVFLTQSVRARRRWREICQLTPQSGRELIAARSWATDTAAKSAAATTKDFILSGGGEGSEGVEGGAGEVLGR